MVTKWTEKMVQETTEKKNIIKMRKILIERKIKIGQ
jgi:hypothetical protein